MLGFTLSVDTLAAETCCYPDRPISMVVAYPPGGSMDAGAHIVVAELERVLQQRIIIQHVGGANGVIGARRVVKAVPDGYTLLLGANNEVVLAPALNRDAGYVTDDLTPIAQVSSAPIVVLTSPRLPIADATALINFARKAHPPLKVGMPGTGSLHDFLARGFSKANGFSWLSVPYRGSVTMMQDLIGGRLDVALVALPMALTYTARDEVTALGVFRTERSPLAPDIPSIYEGDVARGPAFQAWVGLFGPPGLPLKIAERLHKAMQVVLENEDVRRLQRESGTHTPPASSMAAFRKYVQDESSVWQSLK
jgi:tripartite-type tricarboxylate transporter receptor subunit TctC